MIRLFFILLLTCPMQLYASSGQQNHITLTLPEQVIAGFIKSALPLDIDHGSPNLDGKIAVTDIRNCRIKNNHLFADLTITGQNLHLVTNIAGQNIRLRVGTMIFYLKAKTALRYDLKRHTLYVHPQVNEVQSQQEGHGEIANLLLPLINNREFPISMKKMHPFVADTGNKRLQIGMDVKNIKIVNGALELHIFPQIKSGRQAGK